jgi:hypothetical protein
VFGGGRRIGSGVVVGELDSFLEVPPAVESGADVTGGSTSPPTNGVSDRVGGGVTTPLFGAVMSLHAVPATPRHNVTTIATTAPPTVCRLTRQVFMSPRSRASNLWKATRGPSCRSIARVAHPAAVAEIVEITSPNKSDRRPGRYCL